MSTEGSNQNPSRPLTRLERALVLKGLYFPPELGDEIVDSMKAIAVHEGLKDSKELDDFYIKFETDEKNGQARFHINLFGYGHMPGPFKYIVSNVKQYAQSHDATIEFVQSDDQRIKMNGTNLKILVDCIVEGFINKYSEEKNMPEFRVDTDAILNAPRKWVDIAQSQDGNRGKGPSK